MLVDSNRSVGLYGEKLAAEYLRKNGFRVVKTNFRTPFGEIDIIATKHNSYHFIEVKTRVGIGKGMPYEAVNYIKRIHLVKAANIYTLQNKLTKHRLSLDVVSIVLKSDKKTVDTLKHFESITTFE